MKFQTKYFIDDYLGKQVGYLTPLREIQERAKDKSKQWEFECICGNKIASSPYKVLRGHKKSCGCIRYRNIENGRTGLISPHFLSPEEKRFYRKWETIRTRCYNKKHEKYPIYGAKGIKMCSEWEHNAKAFIDWCKETYPGNSNLTIDRINGDGLYSPENCRWATIKEQNRNRKCCVWIDFNGEHLLLAELVERYNQDLEVVRKRINRGWDIEKALITPVRRSKNNRKEHHNES